MRKELTGTNLYFHTLAEVSERGSIADHREYQFCVLSIGIYLQNMDLLVNFAEVYKSGCEEEFSKNPNPETRAFAEKYLLILKEAFTMSRNHVEETKSFCRVYEAENALDQTGKTYEDIGVNDILIEYPDIVENVVKNTLHWIEYKVQELEADIALDSDTPILKVRYREGKGDGGLEVGVQFGVLREKEH